MKRRELLRYAPVLFGSALAPVLTSCGGGGNEVGAPQALAMAAGKRGGSSRTFVTATGDPALDPQNIREAIADPRQYDEIVLQGNFNFGDGSVSSPRQTVVVPRGITFVGDSARVQGGGAVTSSIFGDTESGPFKVVNAGREAGGDDKLVAFRRIAFSGWAGAAIFAHACRGLEVSECEFTQPVPTTGGLTLPGLDSCMSAIWAAGPECRGSLRVEQNVGDLMDYAPLANDEQLAGCHLTNFERISMIGNRVSGHDEGMEVVMNGFYGGDGKFGHIQIERNEVTVVQVLPNPYIGSSAIACLRNRNSSTVVQHNTINLTGQGVALNLSGENITANNNALSLGPAELLIPIAGIVVGGGFLAPGFPADLGPSLHNSTIAHNTLVGTALAGISLMDLRYVPPPFTRDIANESHGNRVINNDMSALNTISPALFAGPDTYDNIFNGCFASVLDMSTANKLHNTCGA